MEAQIIRLRRPHCLSQIPANSANCLFQPPPLCLLLRSCPTKTILSCSPTLSSTSAARAKGMWCGWSPCWETPLFTPATTRRRSSFTMQQWKIPATTCAPMKTEKARETASWKRTTRLGYMYLFQVNKLFFFHLWYRGSALH